MQVHALHGKPEISIRKGIMREMDRKGWTAEEIAVLKEFYPKEGISVQQRLPERTKNQIYGAAWHYGIKNETRKKREKNSRPARRYSTDEIQYLKDNINSMDIEDIASSLGRTPNAVRSAASKHGILSDGKTVQAPWTKEEDQILKDFFREEGIQVENRLKNRSRAAIYSRASHLGLALNKRTRRSSNSIWTKEEDDILRKYYASCGAEKCCSLLKGRSRQAVIVRANRYLGLKSGTDTTENSEAAKDS